MTARKPTDEIQLMERIAQQDQAALSKLYDLYARVIYAVVFKMLGSVEEAEEVVLDVFSQVWRTATRYDVRRGKVDNWLFTMARSRALDKLRSRQRLAKIVDASTAIMPTQSSAATTVPEENLLIEEKRDRIRNVLTQIPVEQRQVIELAYYRGLTKKEIALQTGVSLGTVKTRTRLGLNKLRSLLESG